MSIPCFARRRLAVGDEPIRSGSCRCTGRRSRDHAEPSRIARRDRCEVAISGFAFDSRRATAGPPSGFLPELNCAAQELAIPRRSVFLEQTLDVREPVGSSASTSRSSKPHVVLVGSGSFEGWCARDYDARSTSYHNRARRRDGLALRIARIARPTRLTNAIANVTNLWGFIRGDLVHS